mmetsp:Transcript_19852/g.41391  ORF Transcript_19852/g.41391 Transcript_19852/m.41391 type:complete len:147 (+) Transcript_19852:1-441(+)
MCFEEVRDDRQIANKDTFPVQSYDEEDGSRSVAESSVAGTAADGILGALGNEENSNPAEGMGIKTPIRRSTNITGSDFGDDSEIGMETPMSEMTPASTNTRVQPLGIMSMRKLPPATPDTHDDDKDGLGGGLNRMVLGRLQYDNRN